jgi:hypothetical protein
MGSTKLSFWQAKEPIARAIKRVLLKKCVLFNMALLDLKKYFFVRFAYSISGFRRPLLYCVTTMVLNNKYASEVQFECVPEDDTNVGWIKTPGNFWRYTKGFR